LSNVNEILNEVLDKEGWPTYTEHPNDRGGPTKGGITLRTLESWRHRRCTRKELQRLQKNEAVAILQRRYAEANGIQRLEGHLLQPQLVDSAVLSGPVLAVKELQRVLGVTDDGICGPVTMTAINALNPAEISNNLAITRSLRMARIALDDPTQRVFLLGWLTRTLSFIGCETNEE
jgi:lysozyme family protein